mgnify:CR=1 FL=1
MDNITHSLVGLAVGEAAYEIRRYNEKPDNRIFRRYLLIASIIANNFPDVDVFYSGLLGRLGNLLHHRGHTHTILMALPEALLLFFGLRYFARFRKHSFEKMDWRAVGALCFLGPLIHLWLDGLNSYGVHPFWPFSNRWFYGDTLFIVEPWLWVTLTLSLIRCFSTRYSRIALATLAIIGVLLTWGTGMVPYELSVSLTVWAILFYFAMRYISPRWRMATGLFAVCLLVLGFNRTSSYIKKDFAQYYLSKYEETSLKDTILSPFPANPFCWTILTVELHEDKTHYFMRRGVMAPFPKLMGLSRCEKTNFTDVGNFQADPKLEHVHWLTQVRVDLKWLKYFQDHSCLAKEFLQFSRAPFLMKEDKQVKLVDLRFVRKSSSSFSEVVLVDDPKCLKIPVPWIAPRQDVLNEYSLSLIEEK